MPRKRTAAEVCYHLPVEIVSYIFRFLRLADIRAAALVCQMWSRASDDPLLWRNVTALLFSKKRLLSPYLVDSLQRKNIQHVRFRHLCSAAQIVQVCKQLGPSLKSVYFQGCRCITEELFEILIKSCSNLSNLNLSRCRQLNIGKTCTWMEKVERCSNLQELDIGACKEITDDTVQNITRCFTFLKKLGLSSCKGVNISTWQMLIDKFPNLTSIDLSRSDISDDILLKFAQLRSLSLREINLSACRQLSDNGVVALVKYQTKLKVLRLACVDIRDTTVAAVDKYLHYLAVLDLNSCRQITDGGLLKCRNLLKSLESLNLYACYQISSKGLGKFFQQGTLELGFSPLRCLILNGCSLLLDDVIVKFSKSLFKLQELDVSSCLHLTDEGFRVIADNLTELRVLKLSWCANITDTGLLGVSFKDVTGKKTKGLSNLRQLRSLDISHCTCITDTGIQSIYSLRHLISLNINMCIEVTDATLVGLSTNLPWLENLSLSGCNSITDEGLISLALGLSHLLSLDISKCDGITDHSILTLAENSKYLTHLDLSMCSQITSPAIEKLEMALPGMFSLQLRYSGAQFY